MMKISRKQLSRSAIMILVFLWSVTLSPSAGFVSGAREFTSAAQLPRTLSFPAAALSHNPSNDIIKDDTNGLRWQFNFRESAGLLVRRPYDYAGGDVTFRIFFQTTTPATGLVQFFIRPRSLDPGDGLFDAASITSGPVIVTGTSGFGTMYEQTIIIPANRLTKDWWFITIQRQGSMSTYSDDVVVFGVALEYLAL